MVQLNRRSVKRDYQMVDHGPEKIFQQTSVFLKKKKTSIKCMKKYCL